MIMSRIYTDYSLYWKYDKFGKIIYFMPGMYNYIQSHFIIMIKVL